jgi:predicted metalloprotease
MRWRGRRQSENVEDRRGQGGRFGFPFPRSGGRGLQFPIPSGRGARGGGISIVGLLIILGLMFFFGVDPRVIMQGGPPGGTSTGPRSGMPKIDLPDFEPPPRSQPRKSPANFPGIPKSGQKATTDEMKSFISVVLADTEDVWNNLFGAMGRNYSEPKLILFSGFTQTRCGPGMSAMGPFYCPLDQKVYVDLSFYEELRRNFGANGDFAQAYVIAHEVGHHVQTLLGIADKVQRAKARASTSDANRIQVMMELQADCFAGVWAQRADQAKNILEEALNAASAIGDDRIQKKTQGYVVPDAFTHGTSKQRVRWFHQGYASGDLRSCDTFNAPDL